MVGGEGVSTEADYWKANNGYDYNAMFKGAYVDEFAAQESWLAGRVRPGLKVLELGCGPGRLAKVLSDKCIYSGTDISTEMTRPLVDAILSGLPATLLRHGTVPKKQFDVAFCVSVLIHVPPENLAATLGELSAAARKEIWLVENKQHAGESLRTGGDHGGCWAHDYGKHVPEGWRMSATVDLCRTHDAYVLVPS